VTNCRYVGRDQPRVLPRRHLEKCAGGCEGCLPCTEPHCVVQWHGDRGDCETHAVSVCPACLGKTREHLTEIVRLSGLPMLEQALAKGTTESEAALLLGPVADWHAVRQRSAAGHVYGYDARIDADRTPLQVLGWWDMIATEHLGHRRTQRITERTAAAYLDTNLPWLAADGEFDFPFFANSIAECRTYLEGLLREGEQHDRGAPCLRCGEMLEREWAKTEEEDRWRCPKCKDRRSPEDYRRNVAQLHNAHAEWLTDKEMSVRTGIRAGTVREWARRGIVAKKRDSGRVVYAVADVDAAAREKGMIA